jgi:hypothetical protein
MNRPTSPSGPSPAHRQDCGAGSEVVQHEEEREGWKDRCDYWYHVIVPVRVFPKGLFAEMALVDPDPDLPEIGFINAREEV